MKSEEKLQFYFLAVGKHWRDWFWLVEIRMLSANAAERNRPKLGSCFVSDVCKVLIISCKLTGCNFSSNFVIQYSRSCLRRNVVNLLKR